MGSEHDDRDGPSQEGTTRDAGGRHLGKVSTSPYPMSRLAPVHDLVDIAREVQKADATLGTVTAGKLALIAQQIRALQERGRELLEKAERDAKLHRATCHFQKRVGHVYHVYARPDGSRAFSMIAPDEWGSAQALGRYEGSYRLEPDMSFTPVDPHEEESL